MLEKKKNNIMILKRITIVFAMLFLPVGPALWGQEITMQVDQLPASGAIVRDAGSYGWMVCSMTADGVAFALVDVGATQAGVYHLRGVDTVMDMEVEGEKVYFCGRTSSTPARAVMGYFPLAGFPNISIKGCTTNDSLFSRIEVFRRVGGPTQDTHVVMIGVEPGGTTKLIDAIRVGNTWLFHKAYDTTGGSFRDIAQTQTKVIAISGKVGVSPVTEGKVWTFSKPVSWTSNLFTATATVRSLPELFAIPVGVCAMGTSDFVVVSTGVANTYLTKYSDWGYPSSIVIPNSVLSGFTAREVRRCPSSDEIGVLARTTYPGAYSLYHVGSSDFTSSGTLHGHKTSPAMTSLSVDGYGTNTFVLAGKAGAQNTLSLFRCSSPTYGSCSQEVTKQYTVTQFVPTTKDPVLNITHGMILSSDIGGSPKTYFTSVQCSDDNKEPLK